MPTILFLAAVAVFGWAIWSTVTMDERVKSRVYGPVLTDDKIAPFLDKYLDKYTYNKLSWESEDKMLVYPDDFNFPYMSKIRSGQWNISGYGRVKQGTKAYQRIEAKFDSIEKEGKKSLSDL